jgi:hypothetical protein
VTDEQGGPVANATISIKNAAPAWREVTSGRHLFSAEPTAGRI